MKKLVLLILVGMFVLSPAACSPGVGSTNTGDAASQEALASMPYFGDTSKCAMTAEQAAAYAQLIADGIAGKVAPHGGYGEPLSDVVFWEEPFYVQGYSLYQTDRALVMLGDFAGDGTPYLYLMSSLVPTSFEVYGWSDGTVVWAIGEEAFEGRQTSYLYETKDGTVEMDRSGSGGAGSHSGATYRFINGAVEQAHTWSEEWDYDADVMRVVEDGVETIYTEKQWLELVEDMEAGQENSPEPSVRTLPYAPFSEVEDNACTLREMISYLNQYAAAVSSGTVQEIKVPTLSSGQEMAKAMLLQLDGMNGLTYVRDGLTYARLLDMNGDGTEELILGNKNDALNCTVYFWKDRQLQQAFSGFVLDGCVYLMQAKNGAYCVNYNEQQSFTNSNKYCFLTYTDNYTEYGGDYDMESAYMHNGEEISESEFEQGITQYQQIEYIHNYWEPVDSHIDETAAVLQKMLTS